MTRITNIILSITAFVLPVVTFAQNNNGDGLAGLLDTLGGLINTVIALLFALAVLGFFYGLALYIFKSGSDKETGINIMIYGTIALFVMASIYGIIGLLQQSFNVDNTAGDTITVPTVPGNN